MKLTPSYSRPLASFNIILLVQTCELVMWQDKEKRGHDNVTVNWSLHIIIKIVIEVPAKIAMIDMEKPVCWQIKKP